MIHTYDTRNKENFTTVEHKLKFYEKLPIYTGDKFFNLVPKMIKDCKNYKQLKNKLAQYHLDTVYYSIEEVFYADRVSPCPNFLG